MHYLETHSVLLISSPPAEHDRKKFLSTLPLVASGYHEVDRKDIHTSVISLFRGGNIVDEFPLKIRFKEERGVDAGGVYRDMLSAFWDNAYQRFFDGGSLLAPVLHPNVNLDILPILGTILSHGYLACGFLPIRISFPTLATLVLNNPLVSEAHLIAALLDTVSCVEANLLKRAMQDFSTSHQIALSAILSRFGTRQLPTAEHFRDQLACAARYEYIIKPSAALDAISRGIPASHRPFWCGLSVETLYSIYSSLTASPEKVLSLMYEPDINDPNQERVLGYLTQYVGDMKPEEIRRFLRFVTGSPVCCVEGFVVSFNSLEGAARRPITHTCSRLLELSSAYTTYDEFTREFRAVLFSDEDQWVMNSI